MRAFGELEEAQIRSQFRAMYHDMGIEESIKVLHEIIVTASILAEVLVEESTHDQV